MSVDPPGSPRETRKITLNMLNVQIDPRTTAGPSAGRRCGTVMCQNRCHALAPSTSAASYMSRGTDSSAPSATTIMNGKPSQVLVTTLAVNADENDENHDTSPPSPAASRSESIAPCSLWNMPFQISAVM